MKVREVLEDVSAEQGHPLIKFLAPVIEKGLRAAAMQMNAVHGWADGDVTATEVNLCLAAGIAAMKDYNA